MDKFTKYHIMAGIRRSFLDHPNRLLALEKAKRYDDVYLCADCGHLFKKHKVVTDHVNAVGSFTNWDEFISRVFVEPDKLQVLCIKCHKKKTKEEMKIFKEERDQRNYLKSRTVFDEIREDQEKLMKEPSIIS